MDSSTTSAHNRHLTVLPYRPTVVSRGEGTDQIAMQRAWVEVDLGAIQDNVRSLMDLLQPGTEFWAVVKANGYGHGAVPVAEAAITAGASGLCVATLDEGLELRQAGIEAPILLLGVLHTVDEIREAMEGRLEITLTDRDQISACEQVASFMGQPVPIHLNVDTGMSRLGVPCQEALPIWQDLLANPNIQSLSLYSHFATADELNHPATKRQFQTFQSVIQQFKDNNVSLPPLHLSNSAGTMANSTWHFQRVRVGLAMYGISPTPFLSDRCQLRPALTVKARIMHLKTVPASSGVSYGHQYITPQNTRLATVAIGYADGVPRRLSGQLKGFVGDHRLQQVGNVTMDQTIWIVPEDADLAVGDVVNLFSEESTPQLWADQLGTIPYEILCGFSARLPRRLLGSPE